MQRSWFLGLMMGALFAGCSDDGGGSGGAGAAAGTGGGAGGAGASAGASNGGSGACDPKPGSDAGKSDAGNSTGGVVVGAGGSIDLDGGSTAPLGRMKCWDADSGAGFMCENFGMACCEKKDVCYDPATEPSFCDYPYCD